MTYTLGIDGGVASLGTAVIREAKPPELGVRIFKFPALGGKNTEAGMKNCEDIPTRNPNHRCSCRA